MDLLLLVLQENKLIITYSSFETIYKLRFECVRVHQPFLYVLHLLLTTTITTPPPVGRKNTSGGMVGNFQN